MVSCRWRVDILPQLERQQLYNNYDMQTEWNLGSNEDVAHTKIESFRCPTDPIDPLPGEFPRTAYVGVVGENTMWPERKAITLDDVSNADRLTQTAMIVEACGARIPWAEPRDVILDDSTIGFDLPGDRPNHSSSVFSSYHSNGANVIFGDNSGKLLSNDIDPKVLRAILTADGGEKLSSSDF